MDSILSFLVPIILVVLVLLVLAANVRVVPQSRAFVIERLGAFRRVGRGPVTSRSRSLSGLQRMFPEGAVVDFPPSPSSPRTMLPCRSIR